MHHISRRLSFSPSLSKNNQAFAETSYIVGVSNVWSRRYSAAVWSRRYSAAASSAAADDVSSKAPERSKKRISKAERKSLVESFVNNYREVNSGKFPTASEARKEVGGSFYLVRQIIQELEYETRVSSTSLRRQSPKAEVSEKKEQSKEMDIMEKVKQPEHHVALAGEEMLRTELPMNDLPGVAVVEEKEAAKKINLSSGTEPVSDCQMVDTEIKKVAHTPDSNDVASVDAGEKPLKGDASVLDQKNFPYKNVTSSANDDQTEVITSKTDLFNEETKVISLTPEIPEDNMKKKTITKDDHQRESPITEELARDMSKEHRDDVESSKKSFSWSLKSIADGIINFWRKL